MKRPKINKKLEVDKGAPNQKIKSKEELERVQELILGQILILTPKHRGKLQNSEFLRLKFLKLTVDSQVRALTRKSSAIGCVASVIASMSSLHSFNR